ncbi:MAG: phytanoyl-CoA dioxygenase family protein [Sphingobacteriales bacterium JAD_PAG50586_3]|nr:MAG: phytanoyl-CoA dioxygenase family protein [Sphingobacteriales bacterium JAD_PAG50586_3]
MAGFGAIEEIRAELEGAIAIQGYYLVKNLFTAAEVAALKADSVKYIEQEADVYGREDSQYGRIFSCTYYGGSFIKVLEHPQFNEPFRWYLGDYFIVHVYTTSSVQPDGKSFFGGMHIDNKRFLPQYTEGLGCLVLLDDFTIENGATYLLPGSHLSPLQPSDGEFYRDSVRLVGNAGDVLYFNPRLWHAAGRNNTGQWRHSLSLGMSRPHIKQYTDIPASLKNVDLSNYSDTVLQRLGVYAQAAPSVEEYYKGFGRKWN